MISSVLSRGDLVKIKTSKTSIEYGCRKAPDGTQCVVCGFGEIVVDRWRVELDGYEKSAGIKPGIYANKHGLKVKLPDGKIISIGIQDLVPWNQEEYDKQEEGFRKWQADNPKLVDRTVLLRELPEYPFWEGDIVRMAPYGTRMQKTSTLVDTQDTLVIDRVCYDDWQLREGSARGTYTVIIGCAHVTIDGCDIELVERGYMWRKYQEQEGK